MKIAVVARAYKDGAKAISIERIPEWKIDSWRAAKRTISWTESARVDDWQSAVFDDLADARAGIMQAFGIDWFNRARKQLDAIVEV